MSRSLLSFLLIVWSIFGCGEAFARKVQSETSEVQSAAQAPQNTAPQKKSTFRLMGSVVDGFTGERLREVHIEVRDERDSIIDTLTTDEPMWEGGTTANFAFTLMRGQHYQLRFICAGYESGQYLFNQRVGRRERWVRLGEIGLQRSSLRPTSTSISASTADTARHSVNGGKDIALHEAKVVVSRVKMVVRGDTLVYNADAFSLCEGSMLDELIRRLPGVRLQGGRIYVNGQYVEELLVNGSSFFQGNPRIALENLPSYMVHQVKVYHRAPDWEYLLPTTHREELPLVVDVQLKRDYAVGWSGNVEGGMGLGNRYLARLFGLRFSDVSRLATYAQANNTNREETPGTSGDWGDHADESGNTALQTAGLELELFNKKKTWNYSGNLNVNHKYSDELIGETTETFLPSARSTYARMSQHSTSRSWGFDTHQSFSLKRTNSYHAASSDFRYWQDNGENLWRNGEFTARPFEQYRNAVLDSLFTLGSTSTLFSTMISRSLQQIKNHSTGLSGYLSLSSHFKMPHSEDNLVLEANVNGASSHATSFNDYRFSHSGMANALERQHQYQDRPDQSISANVALTYAYSDQWGKVEPAFRFGSSWTRKTDELFRLDRLGAAQPRFGALPSTRAELWRTRDASNSVYHRTHEWWGSLATPAQINLHGNRTYLSLTPTVNWQSNHLDYQRGMLDVHPTQRLWTFGQLVTLKWNDFSANYHYQVQPTDLFQQQSYVDSSDPLAVHVGNPQLQHSRLHALSFSYGRYGLKWWDYVHLSLGADLQEHAVAQTIDFDATTGIRTYMPRNVEGNWQTSLRAEGAKSFGADDDLRISSTSFGEYEHSVDYVSERSEVHNWRFAQQFSFEGRWERWHLNAGVIANYLYATSPRLDFSSIHSLDLTYSLEMQLPTWQKWQLETTAKLYHRMGYSDATLNTAQLVVNARLRRPLLHGRMTLTLEGFDLFQALSPVTKVINAQGTVEHWYNTLPSYAMLRLSFRLSKPPKRQQDEASEE